MYIFYPFVESSQIFHIFPGIFYVPIGICFYIFD